MPCHGRKYTVTGSRQASSILPVLDEIMFLEAQWQKQCSMWCLNGPDSGAPCQLCAGRKAQTANQGCPENQWVFGTGGGGGAREEQIILCLEGKILHQLIPSWTQKRDTSGHPLQFPREREAAQALPSVPLESLNAVASSLGLGWDPMARCTLKGLFGWVHPSLQAPSGILSEPRWAHFPDLM